MSDAGNIDAAILSAVGTADPLLCAAVRDAAKRYVCFTNMTPTPLRNRYATPETLGPDRLAAAVGAWTLYPGENIFVADFGTAITLDVVTSAGEFLGGNISPGAATRFRALHDYTSTLPLVALPDKTALTGDTTACAIANGVVNGIVYEIEGYMARLEEEYPGIKIIFTGGDGKYFAERLKNPIFAVSDLVICGLNSILEFNANEEQN